MSASDKELSSYRKKIGVMRNHYLLMASRCFDLHKDYERYSVGGREFEIEKVNVLQRNQYDFILVDNGEKQCGEDLFETTTANQGALNVEINLIQDYLDVKAIPAIPVLQQVP